MPPRPPRLLHVTWILLLLAATQVSQPVSGATSDAGNIQLGINEIAPAIVKASQTEPSGAPNDGRIIVRSGAGAALDVNYDVWIFDRNGETDLATEQVTIAAFKPDANGARCTASCAPIDAASNAVLTPVACGTLPTTGNPASALSGTGAQLADDVADNGLLRCRLKITFNSANNPTPAGEYTLRISTTSAASRSLITTAYAELSQIASIVDSAGAPAATLSFGIARQPTGNNVPSQERLKVANQGSGAFETRLQFTDVSCPTTGVATPCPATSGPTTVRRSAIRVREALNANPADPTAASPAPDAAGVFTSALTLAAGSHARFSFLLTTLANDGQTNAILKDGTYRGTITITMVAQTGANPYWYDGTNYNAASPNATDLAFDDTPNPPDGLGPLTVA